MAAKVKLIPLAETSVPIETVLADLFEIEVPRDAGDWKSPCPLGSEHSDGGRTKAMRVYSDNNTAWCFSHAARYTPVSLWQMKSGVKSPLRAAKELLAFYEIPTEPPTPDERWAKLEEPSDHEELDRANLKEVFRAYVWSLPGYSTLQYDEETLDLVSKILRTADKLPSDASYATLENWLETSKAIMTKYWSKYSIL